MSAPARRRLVLRAMTEADLGAVRRVERAAYHDAWSRRTFEQELRNQLARYVVAVDAPVRPAARGWLAWWRRVRAARDPVVGFVGVWYMLDQLHVVTVAVDPGRQGEGIGARLLFEACRLAREAELPEIVLEVRVSNERAQALYRALGFRVAGRLAAYYQDDGEDAFVMILGRLDDDAVVTRLDALEAEHRRRRPAAWGEADLPAGATGARAG